MDKPWTLHTLLEKHPEWGDLPLAAGLSDGSVDFIGWAGSVYPVEHHDYVELVDTDTILVFSPN
jgi:hypothetical protein